MIAFVTILGKYFWNILEKSFKILKFSSYYFIKVHVKNLAKHVILLLQNVGAVH